MIKEMTSNEIGEPNKDGERPELKDEATYYREDETLESKDTTKEKLLNGDTFKFQYEFVVKKKDQNANTKGTLEVSVQGTNTFV